MMDNYPDYYTGPQLTGIPGAIAAYAKASPVMQLAGKGLDALGNMLPVNQRAIYENELAGQGIMVNDIGQIVSDGGNINTAQNIMAGYNAAKVDADTFAKRRAVIEKNMKDPVQKAAKLKALAEAEAIMLGTAKDRADMVFDDKSKQKDPDYINAEKYYLKALSLEADHIGSIEYLGELYYETDRVDKAKSLLEKLGDVAGQDSAEYKELSKLIN